MDEKSKYLFVKQYLDSIQGKILFDEALSYRESYILNDIYNQLRDSISVLDLEDKYYNNK